MGGKDSFRAFVGGGGRGLQSTRLQLNVDELCVQDWAMGCDQAEELGDVMVTNQGLWRPVKARVRVARLEGRGE